MTEILTRKITLSFVVDATEKDIDEYKAYLKLTVKMNINEWLDYNGNVRAVTARSDPV